MSAPEVGDLIRIDDIDWRIVAITNDKDRAIVRGGADGDETNVINLDGKSGLLMPRSAPASPAGQTLNAADPADDATTTGSMGPDRANHRDDEDDEDEDGVGEWPDTSQAKERTRILAVGTEATYDGDRWLIEAILPTGQFQIRHLAPDGAMRLVDHAVLYAAATSAVGDAAPPAGPVRFSFALGSLDPKAVRPIRRQHNACNAIATGYLTPEAFKRGQIAAGCDPETTTLRERIEFQANRLKLHPETMARKFRAWTFEGPLAFVDGRSQKQGRLPNDCERVLTEIIREIYWTEAFRSKFSNDDYMARAEILLRTHPAAASIGLTELPPARTFARIREKALRGLAIHGSTKAQRAAALRPEYPFHKGAAEFCGQIIQIDSTPLDLYCWDSYGNWVKVQLVACLDLRSRGIAAWRVVPGAERQVDAVLLLADMINPRPGSNVICVGVPDAIEAVDPVSSLTPTPRKTPAAAPTATEGAGGSDQEPGSGGGVVPAMLVSDRGKVYLSETFQSGCARLGVASLICPPYRPQYKPQIERFFDNVRRQFAPTCPGYKGKDVHERGVSPDLEAFLTISEVEELFASWLADYHRCPHSELRLPGFANAWASPAELWAIDLNALGGFPVPDDAGVAFDLLQQIFRQIDKEGVSWQDLHFDHAVFNGFRYADCPYTKDNKWPFKVDERDMTHIFFRHPDTAQWYEIPLAGFEDRSVAPFGQLQLDEAKAYLRTQPKRRRRDEYAHQRNVRLLDAVAAVVAAAEEEGRLTLTQQRRARRGEVRAGQAQADQARRPPTAAKRRAAPSTGNTDLSPLEPAAGWAADDDFDDEPYDAGPYGWSPHDDDE